MFASLTSRGALAASTALVAVGVVFLVNPSAFRPGSVGDMSFAPTPAPQEVAPQELVKTAPQSAAGGAVGTEREEAPVVMAEAMEMAEADMIAADRSVARMPAMGAAPSPAPMMEPRIEPLGGLVADMALPDAPNTEAFANEAPNPLKITAEEPVSTFSIDVDTASYSVVRNALMSGSLPGADAVRVEEMVNYFPYDYPAPDGTHPFRPTITVMETPWNAGTQLVHVGIQGEMPELDARPALNLVFLIDTSGSMDMPNKLPLLKQSFRLMLSELRPEDEVSIVAYAGSAGQVLEPTPAGERATIMAALERLSAGGSTAGQAGLQQAYAIAAEMQEEGEISRVILATDGDFNVGLSDPDALKDYIAGKRESGTYLSVLGFGRGNLDDATMQALAQNGNGQAAYIDTLSEAQKVLVDQLSGALFPIANDVKIQVEFNPAQIAEYRLIGYETRALRREDFNNDRVDAGEIGAGHSVTALYEVTPVGSDAVLNDPLRYGGGEVAGGSDELGFFRMRYKLPGESVSSLIEMPMTPGMGEAGQDMRFAAAIAGFGQLLRDGSYLGSWGWDEAIALASANKGEDSFGYRAEAVTLMRLAQSLSNE
jgi:Ca-activated chloride channel family protein